MGVRDFKAPGSRAMAAFERSFTRQYLLWSRKYLLAETRRALREDFSRDGNGVKFTGKIKKEDKPKREYVGSLKELQRLFESWYLKGYSKAYRDTVKLSPDPADILERVRFETTQRARDEVDELKIALYDSIRDYMAKLGRYQQRNNVPPPTEAYVRRQLMGLEGPAPQQWDGAPTPPGYRFRGKRITTHGQSGIDGEDIDADPFGVARRARVIARTELAQARNAGADKALRELGEDGFKQWVSFNDGGTRSSHRHIDGAVVPVADSFKWISRQPGKYKGREVRAAAPGALTLPPAERINCRCTIVSASARDFEAWQKKNPGKVIKHG